MGGPTGEINRLEGCVNDLTRVLALPAAWVGRDASRVVTVLLDTLFSMLRLEFAYARVGEVDGEPPLEIVRVGASGGAVAVPRTVGAALADCWNRGDAKVLARPPAPGRGRQGPLRGLEQILLHHGADPGDPPHF